MEKVKMSTTKKLTIAVTSLAVALCLVIGGLIGIWAAVQQTVGSSFDVQYQVGALVAANVTAKFQREGDADATPMGEGITFNANDAQGTTSYDKLSHSATIALEAETNDYVIFTYTFKNLGETAYTVHLADGCDKQNVTVEYSSKVEETGAWKDIEVPVAVDGDDENTTVDQAEIDAQAVVVTIKVSIANANLSAHYTSTQANGIVWTLTAVGAQQNP